jgi:colicin import membrane protein
MALAVLVALTAGASAKPAPKASGGDEMEVQINGKMYKLVPLPQAKDAKEKGEADKEAKAKKDKHDEEKAEHAKKGKGEEEKAEHAKKGKGEEEKAEHAKKGKGDEEKAEHAKKGKGEEEKAGKAVGAASPVGKKVILIVDGKQYVAVILGAAPGKVEPGRMAKGADEKSAKAGRDKDDDEKGAKAKKDKDDE